MRPLRLSLLALALTASAAAALDISPSRENIPNKENPGTGNRFSIFSGDPARIQRANSVDFKDFTASLALNPGEVSLKERKAEGALATDSVKVSFNVKNVGKRTCTLSFPNAQRYELTVKNPAGQLVYQWSLDKRFVEEVGLVMINPTDRIGYADIVSLSDFYAPLEAGTYDVEVTMANYPEIHASAKFVVRP